MSQGSPYGQYEFNKAENDVIGTTGGWVKACGMIHLGIGAIAALWAIKALLAGFRVTGAWAVDVTYVVYAGLLLFLGTTFRSAGQAFMRVVDTQGNDIPNMMAALDAMGKAFKALVICICMATFLVTVAAITAMSMSGR